MFLRVAGVSSAIYNKGHCRRDFTYVGDIVEGVCRVMDNPPEVRMGEEGLRAFARWYKEFYGC